MIKLITLDSTSDPKGYARSIYQKWNFAPLNGFILNTQDVVERAWFHYSCKSRKDKKLVNFVDLQCIAGKITLNYDDTSRQLKGSTPNGLIAALNYWGSTGEEW